MHFENVTDLSVAKNQSFEFRVCSIVTCYAWRVGTGCGAFRRILISADLTDCIHKPCLSAFMMYVCINVLIYMLEDFPLFTRAYPQLVAQVKIELNSKKCLNLHFVCKRQFHRNIFSLSKILKYFQPL